MSRRAGAVRAVRAAVLLACVVTLVGPAASVASPVTPDVRDRLVDPRTPRDLLDPRPEPAPRVPGPNAPLPDVPGLPGPLDPGAGPSPLPLPQAEGGSRPVPMPEVDVPDPDRSEDERLEPAPGLPGRGAPDGPLTDPRLP